MFLRAVLLTALLLAGAALPASKPKPPIRVLVSESYSRMEQAAALDWSGTGAELVIGLPGNEAGGLYDAGPVTRGQIHETLERIRTLADGRPWYVSFWGFVPRLAWNPATKATCQVPALPETEWAPFLLRFRWLCEEGRALGCQGVVMDSEIYPHTAGGNGGSMNLPAWKDTPLLRARAKAYGQAAGPMALGTWVLWSDASKRAGFGQWWKAAGLDLALPEESFYGKSLPSKPFGATVIPGTWKNWEKISDGDCIALWRQYGAGSRLVWAYDPSALFLSEKGLAKLGRCVARLNGLTPP